MKGYGCNMSKLWGSLCLKDLSSGCLVMQAKRTEGVSPQDTKGHITVSNQPGVSDGPHPAALAA